MANDGCEVNVAADPNNCGVCGNPCSALQHASAACANGACVIGSCTSGYGNCDKVDANGCEAQLASDLQNCGACDYVCPAPAKWFVNVRTFGHTGSKCFPLNCVGVYCPRTCDGRT